MELEFNRKPKRKIIGVRLTEEEMNEVKKIAKENKTSIAETCRVMIASSLKEINK